MALPDHLCIFHFDGYCQSILQKGCTKLNGQKYWFFFFPHLLENIEHLQRFSTFSTMKSTESSCSPWTLCLYSSYNRGQVPATIQDQIPLEPWTTSPPVLPRPRPRPLREEAPSSLYPHLFLGSLFSPIHIRKFTFLHTARAQNQTKLSTSSELLPCALTVFCSFCACSPCPSTLVKAFQDLWLAKSTIVFSRPAAHGSVDPSPQTECCPRAPGRLPSPRYLSFSSVWGPEIGGSWDYFLGFLLWVITFNRGLQIPSVSSSFF